MALRNMCLKLSTNEYTAFANVTSCVSLFQRPMALTKLNLDMYKFCFLVHLNLYTEGLNKFLKLLCRILFFGSFGAARFFWPMLAFFLVVALLHDFFFLTSLPCTIFFVVTAHPPPRRSHGPP